jgi:hypothetical protein
VESGFACYTSCAAFRAAGALNEYGPIDRISLGGTPITRLNAFEKANSHAYPTACATSTSLWLSSRRCHAAVRSRCS